jgi:hypothetical protein
MIITHQSHLDHGLTAAHIQFILARCSLSKEFFIDTLMLPEELPSLPCALRGPCVGGSPVPNEDIIMRVRGDRKWSSRMLKESEAWDHVDARSRKITIIGGPAEDYPCVLYTAYGGPLAPKEPGDPSLTEGARTASVAFWAEHALVG